MINFRIVPQFISVSVDTILVFLAVYLGKIMLIAVTEMSEPFEALVSRAPYLAAIIFLVVYFLRHISAEKQKDRDERLEEQQRRMEERQDYKEALQSIGHSCKEAIDRGTDSHQRLLEQSARIEKTLDKLETV